MLYFLHDWKILFHPIQKRIPTNHILQQQKIISPIMKTSIAAST